MTQDGIIAIADAPEQENSRRSSEVSKTIARLIALSFLLFLPVAQGGGILEKLKSHAARKNGQPQVGCDYCPIEPQPVLVEGKGGVNASLSDQTPPLPYRPGDQEGSPSDAENAQGQLAPMEQIDEADAMAFANQLDADRSSRQRRFTSRGTRDLNPNAIGDFFGSSVRTISLNSTQAFQFHTSGFVVTPTLPGDPNATLVFERNGGIADDFTTIGIGTDQSGDGRPDTFNIQEPIPPNEVPTSPGTGFTFDGGTVVWTGDNTTTQPIDGDYPLSGNQNWYASYSYSSAMSFTVPVGGAFRRIKLSEFNSPLPKTRIYGGFNFYNDVFNGVGDVTRTFLGLEKAFYNNQISIDFRIPFSGTLDNEQTASAIGARDAELGNMVLSAKFLLWQTRRNVVACGLGLGLPTARDFRLNSSAGGPLLLGMENEALHVLPYIAGRWSPSDRHFVIWWAQMDIDASGDDVLLGDGLGGASKIGVLQDPTLSFFDVTFGTWLYKNPCGRVQGIAPVAELHYSTTSNDADAVVSNQISVTSATRRYDVLNTTLGSHFFLKNGWTVTPAMAIPLRNSNVGDRQFDFEAIVNVERRF